MSGSVRLVLDIDTGQIVQRITYDAYGRITQDTAPGTQPFGFKGALGDPVAEEAGLVWMGARAYSADLGRFATPDPAGLAATWNEHDAFAGDPINLIDSDGQDPVSVDVELWKGLPQSTKNDIVDTTAGAGDFLLGGFGGAFCAVSPTCSVAKGRQVGRDARDALSNVLWGHDSGVDVCSPWYGGGGVLASILIPGGKGGKGGRAPGGQGKVPGQWGPGSPINKGVGTRWRDPRNPGNGVRIDRGNPKNSQVTQQVDHVVVSVNGKIIGRDGKPIPGSIKQNPELAHIPLTEWRNWKTWDKP